MAIFLLLLTPSLAQAEESEHSWAWQRYQLDWLEPFLLAGGDRRDFHFYHPRFTLYLAVVKHRQGYSVVLPEDHVSFVYDRFRCGVQVVTLDPIPHDRGIMSYQRTEALIYLLKLCAGLESLPEEDCPPQQELGVVLPSLEK